MNDTAPTSTAPLTDQRLDEIQEFLPKVFSGPWRAETDPEGFGLIMDNALPVATVSYNLDELLPFLSAAPDLVKELLAEVGRLRKLVNPATWTAPDGTVLDLARTVYDRDGDEWVLSEVPPLTMAMADGDLDEKALPHLFEILGPLTQHPADDTAKAGA